MKLHGKKVSAPQEEVIVLPRAEGDLVFKAKAVLDYDEFDKLCPMPEPPGKMVPGGETFSDVKDKAYLDKLDVYAERRSSWMIITSLSATPGLEWETVDMGKPDTWVNFKAELAETGLSGLEATLVINLVTKACGLDQSKIDEATKRFLAGQAELPNEPSSPSSGQESTQSGEPANDSN